MNVIQTSTVNALIANMLALRGLVAEVKTERAIENRVYFQLEVLDAQGNSVNFPELSVSSKGTLWSDSQCAGGEVKSFPTASVMPYTVSLAYADLKIAGVKAPWKQTALPAVTVTPANPVVVPTVDPFASVPDSGHVDSVPAMN